jgi:DNA-binding GntR family transcriptional regulator
VARTRGSVSEVDRDALQTIIDRHRATTETVQELAIVALRQAILDGVMAPGVRLRQEDLAGIFDTSRIPVREALRVLEYEGLVDSEPHRGFTVSSLDADQIDEIYDLRIVLESHAVRLAIPLLTPMDIEDLDRLYAEMVEASDDDTRLAARERFYYRLYSVTARPRLVGLIARLRQEVARSLRWMQVSHSPSHHEEFWEAVRSGDPDLASSILASHYRKIGALIRRFLREARLDGR